MTRLFIVATDPLTTDQEKALKDTFAKVAWWHWLPNFWLVQDIYDKLTAPEITTNIQLIDNTKRALVLQVEGVTWSALTKPDAQGTDMVEWLHKTWSSN